MGLINVKTKEYIGIKQINGNQVIFHHLENKTARNKVMNKSPWVISMDANLNIPELDKTIEAATGTEIGDMTVSEFEKKKAYELMKVVRENKLNMNIYSGITETDPNDPMNHHMRNGRSNMEYIPEEWTDDI